MCDQLFADKIFCGGDILTMDEKNPTVEALAIRGQSILSVGDFESVMESKGPDTEIIHLKEGNTVMPGFIEPHQHATVHAQMRLTDVFINGNNINTYEKIRNIIKTKVDSLTADEWCIFFGWDPELVPDLPVLTADFLDKEFSSEIPIVVKMQTMHTFWANHKALEKAGITDDTKDPDGGMFVKKDGRLTGKLLEVPALRKVLRAAPRPSKEKLKAQIQETWRSYAKQGFTTVTELAYLPGRVKELIIEESEKEECPLRLALYRIVDVPHGSAGCNDFISMEGNEKLWEAGVKIWCDGSPHSGTAAVSEPYLSNSMTESLGFLSSPCYGILNHPDTGKLLETVQFYHDKGKQVAIHAHGERAIEQAIGVYEQVGHNLFADWFCCFGEVNCAGLCYTPGYTDH